MSSVRLQAATSRAGVAILVHEGPGIVRRLSGMKETVFLWMAFDAVLTDPARLLVLLDELDSAGLNLSRLDDVEPVRQPYSDATLRELFTPPVSRELPCRNLIGRGDRATIGIRACIPVEPGRSSANIVNITLKRPRQRDMSLLVGLFAGDFFHRHRVAYAFLDTWPEYVKQHVAGTINERLPGVFWMNWLSRRYLDAIGEDRVLGLPWFRTSPVSDGFACWLYERLDDVPDDRAERVLQIETTLGREKFVKNGWEKLPQLAVSTE